MQKENNFYLKLKPIMNNKLFNIKNYYLNSILIPVRKYFLLKIYLFIFILAQCYLKLRNYERTIKNCNEVLQLDSKNIKALFRISIAYRSLQQFDQARIYLNTAINIEPYNAEIIDEAQRLDRSIEQQKKTEQKLYYRMFNN
jgi:tetratricopeptide (TPR) repeat protein